MKKGFYEHHPMLLFCYFLFVIFLSMFLRHPILTGVSLLCAICNCLALEGRKALKSFPLLFALWALITVTNPLFSHMGRTVLFFIGRTPYTLESLLYGAVSGGMLVAVYLWFRCYQAVMEQEKVLFLFGKGLPKLSLLLTMVFRLLPLYRRRFTQIETAQRALGIYRGKGFFQKLRLRAQLCVLLLTWCLEDAIDTSHSMKARAYGLGARRSRRQKWMRRDLCFALILAIFFAFAVWILVSGRADYVFYPSMAPLFGDLTLPFALAGGTVFLLPTISTWKERFLWRYYLCKM